MLKNKLVSICIPSYNRPTNLLELLKSIDESCYEDLEVVIAEDGSPKRNEIRFMVEQFMRNSILEIKYFENPVNFGYDKNLRELIRKASGEFIIFMGDDDMFVKENIKEYLGFIKENRNLGYILRPYIKYYNNNKYEIFRYYKHNVFFEKGVETYLELFRKSVFISGFTFRREFALPYLTDIFDGTLLFQLYILAEIVLAHPSAYVDIFLVKMIDYARIPYFGTSKSEKAFYVPGEISIQNSVNFVKSFFVITEYIDRKYNLNSTKFIRKDISKYSYRVLSIQRNKGVKKFIKYFTLLNKETHINNTVFYYLYFIILFLFGESFCDKILLLIKKILKQTPKF